MKVENRRRIEKSVVRRLVRDAIKAGYALNVYNGGEGYELASPSVSEREVMGTLFATDEEKLSYYKDGIRVGTVYLVYGNDGYDVVCDYSTSLESLLHGATDLADRLSYQCV